ncbi:hypothetical protein ACFPRL_30325 [Pseudoclavibacter helvolus]
MHRDKEAEELAAVVERLVVVRGEAHRVRGREVSVDLLAAPPPRRGGIPAGQLLPLRAALEGGLLTPERSVADAVSDRV